MHMPIYEYQCDSCGNRIEALQKISDEPLKICSACGSASLRKLVSAASFRLKGKGWYETDFKTGDKKNLQNLTQNQRANLMANRMRKEQIQLLAKKSESQVKHKLQQRVLTRTTQVQKNLRVMLRRRERNRNYICEVTCAVS